MYLLYMCALVLLIKRGDGAVLRKSLDKSDGAGLRGSLDKNEAADHVREYGNISECDSKKPGLYPYPSNCSSYVICVQGGNGTIKICPPHNNFHPDYKVCVWEAIYSCSAMHKSNTTAIEISRCNESTYGIHSDPERCDSYFICSSEGVYHMNCPPQLWFNSSTKKCDKHENVICNVGRTSLPTNIKSIQPPTPSKETSHKITVSTTTKKTGGKRKSSFSCNGKPPGKYAAANYCSLFYVCSHKDEAVLKNCPKHTNFHPIFRYCVWSYVYSCNDPTFCNGKSDGKYKNTNNCYGYYQCSDERTFPRNCNPAFRFNGVSCVDAAQYICSEPSRKLINI